MYDAAVALRDAMLQLGVAVDGGKDSLSMAAAAGARPAAAASPAPGCFVAVPLCGLGLGRRPGGGCCQPTIPLPAAESLRGLAACSQPGQACGAGYAAMDTSVPAAFHPRPRLSVLLRPLRLLAWSLTVLLPPPPPHHPPPPCRRLGDGQGARQPGGVRLRDLPRHHAGVWVWVAGWGAPGVFCRGSELRGAWVCVLGRGGVHASQHPPQACVGVRGLLPGLGGCEQRGGRVGRGTA